MKRITFLFISLFFILFASAEEMPAGYYDNANGKRDILKSLLLKQGGISYTRTSLNGYPRQVTGTSYVVNSEIDPLQYSVYYAVTPEGKEESNTVRVGDNELPDVITATDEQPSDIQVYVQGKELTILNAPVGDIYIYDALGRLCLCQPVNGTTRFSLPHAGVYFIRQDSKTTRILIY